MVILATVINDAEIDEDVNDDAENGEDLEQPRLFLASLKVSGHVGVEVRLVTALMHVNYSYVAREQSRGVRDYGDDEFFVLDCSDVFPNKYITEPEDEHEQEYGMAIQGQAIIDKMEKHSEKRIEWPGNDSYHMDRWIREDEDHGTDC